MPEINPYEGPQSDPRSAPPAIEPEVSVPPPLAIEVIEPETKEEIVLPLEIWFTVG